MKQTTETQINGWEKQRRFLLLLPLLVLPFLTFALWSLGLVGKADAKASGNAKGLNMQLPDAKISNNGSWNKLSFYQQADKDSVKYRDAQKSDPFFQRRDSSALFGKDNPSTVYNPLPPGYEDANEYQVNQKLAQLNAVLNNNAKEDKGGVNHTISNAPQTPVVQSNDVARLAQMLRSMNEPDAGTDPETQQLTGMMDKILDIQHPERVTDRLQQGSEKNKKQVFPVVSRKKDRDPSLLGANTEVKIKGDSKVSQSKSAFYSLDTDTAREQVSTSIEAEVQETQTVTGGSSVKLCLRSDMYVNGILVPRGTFIYGTASQNGDRLRIIITSIRYQTSLLPVSL